MHILLLDDETSVLFALKLLLQALGYQVTDFCDPIVALKHLEQGNAFDLILSDLKMPHMNGLAVLAATKRCRPEIPFVLMSAHATDHEIEQAKQLGTSYFIAKPFSAPELQELMLRINNERKAAA